MNSATDREPMDSAVRVTVLTQRGNGLARPASGIGKRAADEDSEDPRRVAKKHRTEIGDRTDQMVVVYDVMPSQTETKLYTRLHKMDTHHTLAQQFRCARRILNGLGRCAADLLWIKILESETIAKVVGQGKMPTSMKELVESWTFDMPNPNPLSSNYNVSPQFTKLVEVLQACETHDDTFRGIIIVKRPIFAIMIVELLKALDDDLPHLRPTTILKSSATDEVLDEFSSGHYNLVVTTEHIKSLPQISVVVQYNLLQTSPTRPPSWAQNEAQETLVIYMVEYNNHSHKQLLRSCTGSETGHFEARHLAASSVRHRILYDSDSDDETDLECPGSIRDPTTGRTIEKTHALSVMRSVFDPSDIPFKSRQDGHDKYVAGIEYPIGHPLRIVEGEGEACLDEAQKSACFRVLTLLQKKGLLPTSLFPPTATIDSGNTTIEAGKAGQVAKASATTRSYPKKIPQFWTNTLHTFEDKLYPLVVSVSSSGDDHHAPILVLARSWLPEIPDLPVFAYGSRATVHMERADPVRLDQSQLQTLQRYTLRITRAVLNKPLDLPLESMPYFFAPLDSKWYSTTTSLFPQPFPSVSIAWDYVEKAVSNWAYPLLSDGKKLVNDEVQDSIIQDRGVEFTNRYFAVKVREDITPLSKAEEGEREAAYPSFLEYCKSRRKEFDGLKDENQPLVEVSPVPPCINNLSPFSKYVPSVSKYAAKYLIPELCYKFSIPASIFRTALLLPSVMHAVDSVLLIKEVNWNMFSGIFQEERLHAAMVCPTASMEHDYERLELLGDAFLKYAASTYFYVTMPIAREGALHAARQLIISNKALRVGAIEAGLPPYIQSKPVVPKVWKPQIYQTTGGDDDDSSGSNKVKEDNIDGSGESIEQLRGSQTENKVNQSVRRSGGKRKRQQDEHAIQWLGDKTVADVVEAMLGAMYLDGKEDLTLMAAKKLHIPFPAVEHWSDFSSIAPPASDHCNLPPHVLIAVQRLVGYTFKKPALLAEALTHTSNQFWKSYDRLEFLGDAVLDLLTVEHVFHKNPDLSPGGLSMLKGAMVSNTTLATICVLSGLHAYLQSCSKDLSIATTVCVAKVHHLHDTEHTLAEKEGRPPCQFWMELEPPKALSDIVESVIGAIFVDCGFQLSGVKTFFENTLKPFFDQHIRLQTLSDHPNTTLTELFHAEGCQQHDVAKDADGSKVRYDVFVHGTMLASAVDSFSNVALRKAAMAALDALADDPGFITRVCDCRATRQSKKAQKKADKTVRDTQADEDTTMKEAGSDGDEMTQRATGMLALDAE